MLVKLTPNKALLVEIPLICEFATIGIFAAGQLDRDFEAIREQVARKKY